MTDKEKRAIGMRLRRFGEERFGTMKNLASALKMTSQSLQDYLHGRTAPGAQMQAKLKKLGCNIEWLLFGSISRTSLSESDLELLQAVKDAGIITKAEFEEFMNMEEIAQDMAEALRSRLQKIAAKRKQIKRSKKRQ